MTAVLHNPLSPCKRKLLIQLCNRYQTPCILQYQSRYIYNHYIKHPVEESNILKIIYFFIKMLPLLLKCTK